MRGIFRFKIHKESHVGRKNRIFIFRKVESTNVEKLRGSNKKITSLQNRRYIAWAIFFPHSNDKYWWSTDSGQVVAYIVNMVATDHLVGAIFAKSSNCLRVLQRHPVMSVIEEQRHRVDAVIHLSTTHLLKSKTYRYADAETGYQFLCILYYCECDQWSGHTEIGSENSQDVKFL